VQDIVRQRDVVGVQRSSADVQMCALVARSGCVGWSRLQIFRPHADAATTAAVRTGADAPLCSK
jgi:hypothetical protein